MLNEEEKKLLKIFKAQVEKEETEYFSVNAYTQLLYDSHKTVLNLITKLQKENEKYKYLYQKALDNTIISDRENVKLKKQINKMTQYIAKEDKTETFCNYKTVCDNDCEECVEAYFKESE